MFPPRASWIFAAMSFSFFPLELSAPLVVFHDRPSFSVVVLAGRLNVHWGAESALVVHKSVVRLEGE